MVSPPAVFIETVFVRAFELIENENAAEGSPRTLKVVEAIFETDTVEGNM